MMPLGVPCGLVVRILGFHCQVQSLVRELRFCKPCGMAKNNNNTHTHTQNNAFDRLISKLDTDKESLNW